MFRRHALFNHAEIRVFYQVPSVADILPDVMFGCFSADWICFRLRFVHLLKLLRANLGPTAPFKTASASLS